MTISTRAAASTAFPMLVGRPDPVAPADLPLLYREGHCDKPIEFDDNCVMVDTNPLSITEARIRKKVSVPSISASGDTPFLHERGDDKTTTCRSESGTGTPNSGAPYASTQKDVQAQQGSRAASVPLAAAAASISSSQPANVGRPTRRRLSLSSLINNLPAQPTTKLKAFARKLSSSPLTSFNSDNQSDLKSTPAPPIITPPSLSPSPPPPSFKPSSSRSTPKRASTMPVVPRISTSTIPSSSVRSPLTGRKFTIAEMNRDTETEIDGQVIVVHSKAPEDMAQAIHVAETILTFNNASLDQASSVCSSLTALDEDAAYSPHIPLTPQQECFVPPLNTTSFSRRAPFISRNSSFGDDLAALSEVDETDHHDRPHMPTSASAPPSPVAQSAKVCNGIWLCSRPPRSSCPTQATQVSPTLTVTNALPLQKVNRPLVVRSMSTGRLASEFDDDGRVICLSVHSDRVLKPSVSPPPPSSRSGQCWMGPGSRSTPGLLRSQTYQASKRSHTSPSEPSLNKLGLPAQASRTRSDFGKQSSTERLVRVPSSPASTMSRAVSIGSWKRKAWQMNSRSVRV
ncbi:hypothetical protein I316_02209 [Kwoniella heveanensis BCC8398]|uniref:Uncharacterized protein n=1 Tax=Kwoniella heveanensis BCC8398 TaxID=1296120 RepID=A0A1B9GZB0_9TREE|nr:hypothetical protein I316_02209 [Kwoniella heveanensis BCC8398]